MFHTNFGYWWALCCRTLTDCLHTLQNFMFGWERETMDTAPIFRRVFDATRAEKAIC